MSHLLPVLARKHLLHRDWKGVTFPGSSVCYYISLSCWLMLCKNWNTGKMDDFCSINNLMEIKFTFRLSEISDYKRK